MKGRGFAGFILKSLGAGIEKREFWSRMGYNLPGSCSVLMKNLFPITVETDIYLTGLLI